MNNAKQGGQMDIELEMKKDLENAKQYAEMFDKAVLGKIFSGNETVKKSERGMTMTQNGRDIGVSISNARLIAAAPEMLELLEDLIDMEGPQPGCVSWAEKAKAVIKKAKGVDHDTI